MKSEKLFEITHNSDSTEGRGVTLGLGFVRDRVEALKVVNDPRFARYCVMGVHRPGGQNYDIRERDIIVYDSAEEFWEEHSDEEKRRKALAKLTDEEKRLLGLTP